MNSINSQNRISFTSRNHPIPTHVFSSPKGDITISEANLAQIEGLCRFVSITANMCTPRFKYLEEPAHLPEKENEIKRVARLLRGDYKNQKGFTYLVAKNSHNDVVGAALTRQRFCDIDDLGQIGDCYIADIYRGAGIGKHMLKTLVNSAQKTFTAVFIEAENTALGFYKKLGFDFSPKIEGSRRSSFIEGLEKRTRKENEGHITYGTLIFDPIYTSINDFPKYKKTGEK